MAFETLEFQFSWRDYQARVLEELSSHLEDNHLHIVAAPGSGKTILGLETMSRIGEPAIIFAPSLAIRNQWVDRLLTMFMDGDAPRPDWVSKDIRAPKLLTVTTYQALHAAFSGEEPSENLLETEEQEQDEPDMKRSEAVDIISLLKAQNVKTIILDEAHHLRKEWWKALTRLKAEMHGPKIVSLTATPPYDVDQNEWQKYEDLCGPIDSEISVPELVRTQDLCPHQDYVYFSVPPDKELKKIRQFKGDVTNFIEGLKANRSFIDVLSYHPWVSQTEENIEGILGEPKFFSSIIIFLNSAGIETPKHVLQILGARKSGVPDLDPGWLEELLTGVLYTHVEHFA